MKSEQGQLPVTMSTEPVGIKKRYGYRLMGYASNRIVRVSDGVRLLALTL